MSHLARSLGLVAAMTICIGTGGCTVVKPVIGAAIGAVAGPALLLANSNGSFDSCGCDGRGVVVVLATSAAIGVVVGAVCGLVTGAISDVRWVGGYCDDPLANWWDPFKINDESPPDEEWDDDLTGP